VHPQVRLGWSGNQLSPTGTYLVVELPSAVATTA